MNIGYKLVSQDYKTHSEMHWEIGKTNTARGKGSQMCSDQVLHYYEHPLLAVLFNPIHAGIENPRMLRIQCSQKIAGDELKSACKEQTPIEEISLPVISITQRVAFAIKCALVVQQDKKFVSWANSWLYGEDRTRESAIAAAHTAASTAYAAAANAANTANAAANAAAYAAASTAYAAANTANAAAYAVAYAAANTAANAAAAVRATSKSKRARSINFIEIIETVIAEGY